MRKAHLTSFIITFLLCTSIFIVSGSTLGPWSTDYYDTSVPPNGADIAVRHRDTTGDGSDDEWHWDRDKDGVFEVGEPHKQDVEKVTVEQAGNGVVLFVIYHKEGHHPEKQSVIAVDLNNDGDCTDKHELTHREWDKKRRTWKTILALGIPYSDDFTVTNVMGPTVDFNMTLYAMKNDTVYMIEHFIFDSLANGTSATLNFTWDTSTLEKGNYTLFEHYSIYQNETFVANGTLPWNSVYCIITTPGDADGDYDVDIFDVVMIAGIYGYTESDPEYDRNCDIDDDGDIDIFDVVIAAGNYGR